MESPVKPDQGPVRLVDAQGEPLRPMRANMLAGGSTVPYDAADLYSDHMAEWRPYLWSPDGELNMYRDRIVSRVRDLVRNDGWASAAVTRTLDNVIGADFRPISKPDYVGLAKLTGLKAFDHVWAEEFAEAVMACWRNWANDPQKYCDVERNMTLPQLMRLGFRHKIVDGDALAMLDWIPERVGPGRASYATAIRIIDPDRLSNPNLQFDQAHMRGGVVLDNYGATVGYYIRRAHQGDWFSAAKAVHWDYVARETSWGRPVIVHNFDSDRAGQHRGGAGILTPVVNRLKALIKYEGAELDTAILNSIFGAYIESPFDADLVESALGESAQLNAYQQERVSFHNERRLSIGGSRMPILFPGEKITAVSAERPNSNFAAFEQAMLRNVAAGAGVSAQQITQNWADVNYSSYRAAALEAWKTFDRRRRDYAVGFGQPIFAAFLEEAMEVDNLPLPVGAPDFMSARVMYAAAKWQGPGRGYVDPMKEKQGAILGMDAGLSTLEQEAAELSGTDWKTNLRQRALEIEECKKLGIPLPKWATGEDADKTIQEPGVE